MEGSLEPKYGSWWLVGSSGLWIPYLAHPFGICVNVTFNVTDVS